MIICRGLCTAAKVSASTFGCAPCEFGTMNKHFVFVYGTLKRGEPNHYWMNIKLNGYSKFISEAETVEKYPLIIASRHNIPFLLDSPGDGENVLGEVFEVDDAMLSALDELEDHPTIYVREREKVALLKDGKPAENLDCWIYFLRKFKPKYLDREFYKEYSSRGPHGKRYVEREARDPSCPTGSDVLDD